MVHYPPAGKTRMAFPQLSLGPSAFLGGPDQWQWLSTGDKFIGRRGEDGPMVLQDQYVKSWWGQWLKIVYINMLNAKGEWVRGYFTINVV